MEFNYIKTKNLILRKVDPEVLSYVLSSFGNIDAIKFLGLNNHEELFQEKEKLKTGFITFNKSFLYFHLLDNDHNLIGTAGFHTWYLNHNRAELFYSILDEKNKNKGIMTEALSRILDYGFGEMKLHRIEAFVGQKNVPSLSLLKKFNFTGEGLLRQHYLKDNVYQDSLAFSLLKSEY